mgnify:CR=1 FL=1
MTKAKATLLKALRKALLSNDTEGAHVDADEALIVFINDPEITTAYYAVPKWYALLPIRSALTG